MNVKEGRGSGAVVLSLALGGMGSVARAWDEMGLVVLQLPSDGMASIVSDGTWPFGVMASRVLAVAVTAGLTPVLLFIERSVRDFFGRRRWQ